MKPPTFEELLKQVPRGPYAALKGSNFISSPVGNVIAVAAQPEQELILRLLAFANAGGVERLRKLTKHYPLTVSPLVAILDGAAVPGSHYEEKK